MFQFCVVMHGRCWRLLMAIYHPFFHQPLVSLGKPSFADEIEC
jgi:hypothetical protein